MNARETPSTAEKSSQATGRTAQTGTHSLLFRGQSQRADSLSDMLRLDRLISRGIQEDLALRHKQAIERTITKRMLNNARAVLALTRRSW